MNAQIKALVSRLREEIEQAKSTAATHRRCAEEFEAEALSKEAALEALAEVSRSVKLANEVIQSNRLAGGDQNPRGFRDQLGVASRALESWSDAP